MKVVAFILQALALVLLLSGGVWLANDGLLSRLAAESLWYSIGFFGASTFVAFFIAIQGRPESRFKMFLAGSGTKLLFSLGFLIWGFQKYNQEKVIFVLGFMAIYVIFTTLEVAHIMANLRQNSRN